MIFPEIDYKFWLENWNESIGTKKVYSNKNIENYIKFNGNTNECTKEIIELVKSEPLEDKTIFRVIDLIYSWGGKSGRMFYADTKNSNSPREILANDKTALDNYKRGIELAKKGDTQSIKTFNNIIGIGPSYASKHSYFWSINSSHPLIIVDSKIAGALGYKTIEKLNKDFNYSKVVELFIEKAKNEFNKKVPSLIEQALFSFHDFYFLNNNEGWKNKIQFKDYDEAKRIANKLFEN